MAFSRIPIITAYNRGDNILYSRKYNKAIGVILHDLELFNKSSNQEKIDAFIGIYLFSIISVHMDLLGEPKGLDNAKKFKNKIYIITNTIMHNTTLQKLGLLYLEIKILKENNYIVENCEYKNMDQILNYLDDNIIFVIHMILSFNYTKIRDFIKGPQIENIPTIYDIIYPELIIDLLFILSKINKETIHESFYSFDPIIEFNEYGREIIPEHHDIFYGAYSIVRNFRKIYDIKPIESTFLTLDPFKCIDEVKRIKLNIIHENNNV